MATQLDSIFIENMENLANDSFDAYTLVRDGRGGAWSLPPKGKGWEGDLFDFTLLGKAFDRGDIENEYRKAINNSGFDDEDPEGEEDRGTLADLAANKIQAGVLSQRERAYRARHTTPVMAACYAAARRKGHGQNDDQSTGIFGVLINHVSDMINYGR